jgi:nicotinamide-nucleotide amidase
MKAEIVAVGTELLLGQIVNTNARYLSRALAELGIDVYYQTVVGDNRQRIVRALEIASGRADLVVLTGGLGPTQDDVTREAVADHVGRGLVYHRPTLERIEANWAARGGPMPENNRRQALMIEGAVPLPNETGWAVGSALTADGVHYLLLPGPPREMAPMFERYGRAWLREIAGEGPALHAVMLKFAGIGESSLEELLADLISGQSDPTIAPYAKEGEVAVRLATKANGEAEARRKIEPVLAQIRARTADYLYAEEDIALEAAVVRLLTEQGKTAAAAESCTGGLVAELLTNVPGSSRAFAGGIVAYTPRLKRELLGVPASLLEGADAPGAVSAETAAAMAEGMLERAQTDFALSVTGVAGPAEDEGKPVGLVFIGLAGRNRPTRTERLQLSGDREGIRLRAAKRALYMLWRALAGRD